MKPTLFLLALVASAPVAFAQAAAAARLENSPRHHEWVEIARDGRATPLHAFVAYPEVQHRALAVVVIHENRGLTDWVRATADRLAEAGYIAIAPDLLSGAAPGGGRTRDFASADAAREGIGRLKPAEVVADLAATADYVKALPAANGRLAVIGFCWGGTQTWRYVLHRRDANVAAPFYGTAPGDADFATVTTPVHGFYGGNDARVNSTLEKTSEGMKASRATFTPVIYDSAGHAFMRLAEEPDASAANQSAAEQSWTRLLELLARAARD